jgi:hypothetical protein
VIAISDLDILIEARRERLVEEAKQAQLLGQLRPRPRPQPSTPFWPSLALPRLPRRVQGVVRHTA